MIVVIVVIIVIQYVTILGTLSGANAWCLLLGNVSACLQVQEDDRV